MTAWLEESLAEQGSVERCSFLKSIWLLHNNCEEMLHASLQRMLQEVEQLVLPSEGMDPVPWALDATPLIVRKLMLGVEYGFGISGVLTRMLARVWEKEDDPCISNAILVAGGTHPSWDTLAVEHAHVKALNAIACLWIRAENAQERELLDILGRWHGNWDAARIDLAPSWIESAVEEAESSARKGCVQPLVYQGCLRRVLIALEHGAPCPSALANIVVLLEWMETQCEVGLGLWEQVGRLHIPDWETSKHRSFMDEHGIDYVI